MDNEDKRNIPDSEYFSEEEFDKRTEDSQLWKLLVEHFNEYYEAAGLLNPEDFVKNPEEYSKFLEFQEEAKEVFGKNIKDIKITEMDKLLRLYTRGEITIYFDELVLDTFDKRSKFLDLISKVDNVGISENCNGTLTFDAVFPDLFLDTKERF